MQSQTPSATLWALFSGRLIFLTVRRACQPAGRIFDSFRSYIWTRSSCGTSTLYISQTEVVRKLVVRAGKVGPKSNIRGLLVGKDKSLDDLGGWVANNDVVTHKVVAGSVKELDPVGVPTSLWR
jgi:hypothetical protein